MESVVLYALTSVLIVSLISFAGILTLSIQLGKLKKLLLYMVSFSAGGLLGDTFIHLLPEAVEEYGFSLEVSLYLLLGIVVSFVIEKFIRWQHCHVPTTKEHPHPFAFMNLVSDGVHNFIDGLIIGASYFVSIPLGLATTLAIIFHEIPQEIGDFGVLLHGGFSKRKALLMNFLSALTAVLGTVVALFLNNVVEHMTLFFVPLAAGVFIYIAGSDLIPELHKEVTARKSLLQLLVFIAGIGVMLALLLVEDLSPLFR